MGTGRRRVRRMPSGKVDELLHSGYTDVIDADLSKYFDMIPHSELLQCVARRIVDRWILHLLKMWRFNLLGSTFGPHYSMRTGQKYLGYSPANQSVARIEEKVGDLLVPGNVQAWGGSV